MDSKHCSDVAAELVLLPVCCLDELTRRWRRKFHTVALLLSDKCKAILVMLGEACRLDICRVECRHAQLRRFSRSSSTWLPHLRDLSAYYVLMRHRMLAKFRSFLKSRGQSSKKKRGRRKGRPLRRTGRGRKQTRGVGGAWRAHIAGTLRGRRFDSAQARAEAFRETQRSYGAKMADPIQAQGLRKRGQIGSKNFKVGRLSFGTRPSVFRTKRKNDCGFGAAAVKKAHQTICK